MNKHKGQRVRFSELASGLTGGLIGSDETIRLGVTGLSRAGKTVFITSLVANLLNRGRMPQLVGASGGRIIAVYLQPQPDDTMARFEYERHFGALSANPARWPKSTRAVSQLRLSIKIQPSGLLGGFSGPRNVHLDIVDYPGEWLLDLALLDKSYAQWADETLLRLKERDCAQEYLSHLKDVDGASDFSEHDAQALAASFTEYLRAAEEKGYADCTPGRFLLPGELAGSPVLTFAPIVGVNSRRGTLLREMERRYEAYKAKVVKPFFQNHFSKIDRQVVLVDVLGAIHKGPRAVEDLRRTMAEILAAFKPGTNSFLASLFGSRRVERILFAATKADHLHHRQHPRLTAIIDAMLREAKDRAEFSGAATAGMSIAALRVTIEETLTHEGKKLDCVRGVLQSNGKQAAFYPGELPDDPFALLGPARDGARKWLDAEYQVMNFAPAKMNLKPGEGPPHIRMDKAAEFLFGDRLR